MDNFGHKDFLKNLHQILQKNSMRYCFLREPKEEFLEAIPEIDFLVDLSYNERLGKILRDFGFSVIPKSGHRPLGNFGKSHTFYLYVSKDDGWGCALDVINMLAFDYGLLVKDEALTEKCLESRECTESGCYLSEPMSHEVAWKHELFDKFARRKEKIKNLDERFVPYPGLHEDLKNDRPSSFWRAKLASLSDISWLESKLRVSIEKFCSLIDRRIYKKINFVALVGPDGIGKTTIGEHLSGEISIPTVGLSYHYFGRPKRGLVKFFTKVTKAIFLGFKFFNVKKLIRFVRDASYRRHAGHEAHVSSSLLRMRLLEIVLRLKYKSANHLVIMDRCFIDELLFLDDFDAGVEFAKASLQRFNISNRFSILRLFDDPVLINKRKDELEVDDLQNRMNLQKKSCEALSDSLQIESLDIAGAGLEIVLKKVIGFLPKFLKIERKTNEKII